MPKPFYFALGAAFLLAGPASAQDKTAAIDRIFDFATDKTPGCAVGVSQNGKTIAARGYGLADIEAKRPLGPNTLFDIGSTQKQFTAAAVLLLVQDGRLALSDDIRKYLPELPDFGSTVTVNHLLTHTSGVRDWLGLLPMAEEGTDASTVIRRQRGLNFVPGDEWAYSNSGYELAKDIVARVSGMSYAEFTRRRLFEPLGMTSSAYVPDIMQGSGERAIGYQKDAAGWRPFMRLGVDRAGGAVISSASDLLRWNDALTTGKIGKFVSEKLIEPARLNNGRTLKYGRGLMLDSIPGGRLVSHDGGAAGYNTWLGRFTDHGLSIAVLCNFDSSSPTSLAGRVADLFLPPVDPQAPRPGPTAAAGIDVSGRAGLFFEERTGEPMRLVANRTRLSAVGGPVLVPVTASQFLPQRASLFYRSQDQFTVTFTSNDEFELRSMEGNVSRYRRAQPYSASDAELRSVDGRYRGEDQGQVFEIVPAANKLLLRFEKAPEKALELEPIGRDTFMQTTMAIARFRRDASGKVTGFEYDSPNVRHFQFTRLGDRRLSPSTVSPAAPAPVLALLVGEYEFAPGRTITISVQDGKLYGQPSGATVQAMTHVSGATFSVAGAPVTITFTLDRDGKATELIMRQNGMERTLKRIR